MALAARLWRFVPLARGVFPGPRLSRAVAGGRGRGCGRRLRGPEVMGNLGAFKRSLLFSALPYLGFEAYQLFSQAVVVHATAKAGILIWTSQPPEIWYAICISDVGDYEGIKAKIANAYVIKEHFEKAIELNPKDATSIHLMGIWCYTFAEMPWYQRRIAKMLFATPPSSTYEEALGYFHRAEQVDPNFYSKNLLLLGKTYLKLHNKKLAAFWLMKAKDYPAHTEEDKQIQTEAAQLLTGFSDKN
uniref:regulator of microtubule dynamics protein 1 isoform X3 n=1 Tax=Nyctereutes procyonoides TaxID=34880 RepID=UPI00244423E3|nr:regulator of microtubule dynamics protein 1 isoform X3 [Nyctereutes procyonoides]